MTKYIVTFMFYYHSVQYAMKIIRHAKNKQINNPGKFYSLVKKKINETDLEMA